MTSHVEFSAACVALLLLRRRLKRKQNKKPKRKCWVKDWIKDREKFGVMNSLLPELRSNDEKYYKNFLRMTPLEFDMLLQKVKPFIEKQDTLMRKCIPANERLALTLRFLATGDSYASLMYLFRISKGTISLIIPEVCKAIYSALKDEYLKMPSTEEEWLQIASNFALKWDFPNCIGALDGKHINMKAPANSGSLYFNYKLNHSIILMALADANYKFIYINVRSEGRNSDGGVFNNSKFFEALEKKTLNIPPDRSLPMRNKVMPFVIVADDAFAMKSYLLKPYAFNNLSVEERIFNYRLSRARRIIENVFGITSARFHSLRKTLEVTPEKAKLMTCAICVLHNFLMTHCHRYAPCGTFDVDLKNGSIQPGSWRAEVTENPFLPLQTIQSRNPTNIAKEIRSEFKDYFARKGAVDWQLQCI